MLVYFRVLELQNGENSGLHSFWERRLVAHDVVFLYIFENDFQILENIFTLFYRAQNLCHQ